MSELEQILQNKVGRLEEENERLRKDKAELVDGLERVVAIVNSDAAKSYYGARGAFGDVEAVARSLINKNGVSHE